MTQIFHSMIAAILGISEKQIGQTLSLLDDGATIPFISRYRKEMTGGLDEVQIESIRTHYEKLKETAKRKETIVATIREQGKMTPDSAPAVRWCAWMHRATCCTTRISTRIRR